MAKISVADMKLEGKRVLIRCDFNVPLDEKGEITDDTRIQAALPTINYVLGKNCSVILISHLGRPKGKIVAAMSLNPVYLELKKIFSGKADVLMSDDCVGEKTAKIASALKPKQILLLENLRFHAEETDNDENFAKELASLADVFIQEAFGTVHRAHASTAGIPKYIPSGAGFLLQKEIEYLTKALTDYKKPFLAILGGAKVSTKIGVIENLLDKIDSLIIGGGMIYTFLKADHIETGNSLVEEDKLELAREIRRKAAAKKVNLLLPCDHVVADKFDSSANVKDIHDVNIPAGWMGVDIGTDSISRFVNVISAARTILWNGPMGIFEIDKFSKGTLRIAQAIAKATEKGAVSIVGGGDSVSAVKKMGLGDRMSHISTGGGASLEFLEGKEMPGIAALKDK